ncbi:MAG: shikimate dehydrogenase [Bacteroidia bacterium]|nr:shikimate dehydrogenase [Bacteroidia bacterium]
MKLGLLAGAEVISFSPLFFRRLHSLPYAKYTPSSLETLRSEIQQKGWTGFNVTTPYKEAIFPLLDEVSSEAAAIKAVNTVVVYPDGRWKGYNTDFSAARYLLSEFSAVYAAWEHVVILGTGGAGRAVAYAHAELFPQVPITFISRQREKKIPLPMPYQLLSYDQLGELNLPPRVLLVQATPVGMFPAVLETPPFPIELVQREWLVWDLIYNPNPTAFLKKARARGASVEGGLQLFRKQAEYALEIWSEAWVQYYKRR